MRRIMLPGVTETDLPLSPAVVSGNLVFVSGQVPRRADGSWETGSIADQTRCTLDNLETVLAAAGSSLDRLCRTNIYLTHPEDFSIFNQAYRARLGKNAMPARTTIVTSLVTPPEVRIEIDAVAEIEP